MSARDDGGPAFPASARVHSRSGDSITTERITDGGMSLRDYFAAQAVQPILFHWLRTATAADIDVAKAAYNVADAMIAEREK